MEQLLGRTEYARRDSTNRRSWVRSWGSWTEAGDSKHRDQVSNEDKAAANKSQIQCNTRRTHVPLETQSCRKTASGRWKANLVSYPRLCANLIVVYLIYSRAAHLFDWLYKMQTDTDEQASQVVLRRWSRWYVESALWWPHWQVVASVMVRWCPYLTETVLCPCTFAARLTSD